MKTNKKEFLQKYIDHKLNSMQLDLDDFSDYLQNYTDDKWRANKELVNKFGMSANEFIKSFKPTKNEIKLAIEQSNVLNVLAERCKKAVIKGISQEIFDSCIYRDKEEIEWENEWDDNYSTYESAINKLRKAKLTKAELDSLKIRY